MSFRHSPGHRESGKFFDFNDFLVFDAVYPHEGGDGHAGNTSVLTNFARVSTINN